MQEATRQFPTDNDDYKQKLIEAQTELNRLREDITRLCRWMSENLNTPVVMESSSNVVSHAIQVMGDTKTVLTTAWPHLLTIWGNVTHVLSESGILPRNGDKP